MQGRDHATTPSDPAFHAAQAWSPAVSTLRMIFPFGGFSRPSNIMCASRASARGRTAPMQVFSSPRSMSSAIRAQPLGGHFHQKEGCGDPVVPCAVLIRLGHGRDQLAARAKNLKRTHLRLASDEIEHRVGILHLILETLCVIIHYRVGTEGLARTRYPWSPPSRLNAGERDERAELRRLRRFPRLRG